MKSRRLFNVAVAVALASALAACDRQTTVDVNFTLSPELEQQ